MHEPPATSPSGTCARSDPRAAWTAQAHPIGTPLRVSEQGIDGTFDGLAPDGALRLRRDGGDVMLIHAGGVELQPPGEEGN